MQALPTLHRVKRHHPPFLTPTPTTTAAPEGTAGDFLRSILDAKREVVTVLSTLAGQPTQVTKEKSNIPIGPIIGGVIAGVLIVLLAGGFWWWWVANKPRVVVSREAAAAMSGPRQAGARVPPPISTRDSGRSGKSISSPTSEKPYPLVPLSPSSKLKPKQQTRSVSAESQIDLLPSLEQESAPPVPAFPAANKYIPAKPSPLATAKAVSAAPRWGEAPFVSATVPSSSVTRADDSHATSSPLPVPSQPSANSYILAPPISDPTSLAPSTSSQVVTDPTTKRVSHAASVQSAGSYYSQSNIDGPTSPRDRYSEQFEGHVVEGQGSGRKGQVVSGQFDFDNRTSYNPSVIAPPGPAYVGHDGAGYEYGSGPHSGYQSGYAYGGEQQYPPQQYQQYPDYQQQQQYQHRTSYDPRHSQQQQQLQRYSQQGGWDQEGYGPRYTEESGYPAEELDGYYGSNSRPGSYAGPNSGA